MMPEELMKLKFGEAIFMKSSMHPVKAIVKPICDYPINFKMSKLPAKNKKNVISCFDLNKYREERSLAKMNKTIALE